MLHPQIEPRITPPLAPDFVPAVLVNQKYQQLVKADGIKTVIGLERNTEETSRFEFLTFPDSHPLSDWNNQYIERIVKFLLWQRGGHKLYFSGSAKIAAYLAETFSPSGARAFDYDFFSRKVFEKEFQVIPCSEAEIPPSHEVGNKLGGNFNGYRIGFDLGASDRKVTAVIDGVPIFSEEVIWEPSQNSDPDYHYQEIMTALTTAAVKLPRVDAIGGSSAGIYINNRPMVASLFRGIPDKEYNRIKELFSRIQKDMGVPVVVINDGDVTALAGSMAIKEHGILGIALGSSEAAGYVNTDGHIMGWLNELAFAPVDYNPNAPIDEWSGDRGCGVSYFSQQCVFRLAPLVDIAIPNNLSDAEKLEFVQEKLESGEEGAVNIWKTMGVCLGYGIAHYADFYDINHILILGRCTSGRGGNLLQEGVDKVFSTEFPELKQRIQLHLPEEKIRRVGQSVAAASLPYLQPGQNMPKDS